MEEGLAQDNAVGIGAIGSAADVSIESGAYDGFEFSDKCENGYAHFSVMGLGGQWFNAVVPEDESNFDERHEALSELVTTIWAYVGAHDSGKIWGAGVSRGACLDRLAVNLYLSNWADVDALVSLVGKFLSDNDLRETFTISVEAAPVAL